MSTNKDASSLNNKAIYDFTKFSHLDYTDHLSCIVWFSGCNMRCDYCYNKDLVFSKEGTYSYADVLEFLKTRVNLLDAVVLSGGEATTHELADFCKSIKGLGYKIKLDTNGTNYERVKELIDLSLLDFVALDYKAPKEKFTTLTNSSKYNDFSKTLDLLTQGKIDYEVRTTLHSDLLNEDDINSIINDLTQKGYEKKYYLQRFLNTGCNIGNIPAPSSPFDESLLSNELEVVYR